MRLYALMILSFLLIAPLFGQDIVIPDNLNVPIPMDADVKIGKLKNGLTYYIRQNKKPENKVEFRLVVNAGSILENEDQKGLAHFVEHMAFNGSKNFQKNELVNYLQSIGVEFGADLNAYTSFDETVYMLPIPTDDPANVDKGLLVLQDWAGGLTFDPAEIDKERGVVMEEWRLGRGASQRMRDQWFPLLFKDSRYAVRLPIGSEEVIQGAPYATIKQFYTDWYRPDLMAIIAVGDIDVTEMEKKIKATFGKLKNPKSARVRTISEVPDHNETLVSITQDVEAPITQIQLFYKQEKEKSVTLSDVKDDLIASLYQQMINQRLDELRRKENPPFIGGGTGYSSLVKTKSAYYSSAAVGEGGVLQGLSALAVENERVKRHGFTEGELERAKVNLINGQERALKEKDKTESRNFVGSYVQHFLNQQISPSVDYKTAFVKKIVPTITLKDVNALAEKWIIDKNRVVVITAPQKEGLQLPTEEELLKTLADVKTMTIEPYSDGQSGSELVSVKPKKGTIVSEKDNTLFESKEWILSNGARVCWKTTDFQNDEILMNAFSFGGTSIYSDEDYHSANSASTAISQGGVGTFSPIDLKKLLTGKTVNLSAYVGGIDEGMNGRAAPKDLETMFQLIYLHFVDPRKDASAFNSYVNRMKMTLPNLLSNPNYYFQDETSKLLSQNHLRGGGLPTIEDLEKINFDKAFEIYNERFANAGDFNFYFVGNIDEKIFRDFVETYIASLPGDTIRENFKDVGMRPPSGKIKEIYKKGKDPKSSVKILFSGAAAFDFDEDYKLNSLGDLVSNRLIDVIREEKSGVYGVRAGGDLSMYPYNHYNFSISFPCGPEKMESLVSDVFEQLEKIKNEGPSQEEVDEIKKAQLQNRKEGLKKNGYWIGKMKSFDFLKADVADFDNSEERIENLTIEDLKLTAQKYLDNKNVIQMILMPE
jgi:zinc protease